MFYLIILNSAIYEKVYNCVTDSRILLEFGFLFSQTKLFLIAHSVFVRFPLVLFVKAQGYCLRCLLVWILRSEPYRNTIPCSVVQVKSNGGIPEDQCAGTPAKHNC